MERLIRALDWSKTAIGPPENWPVSLKHATNICLTSSFPILLLLGPKFIALYNDAFISLAGIKHPDKMLGFPIKEARSEIWHTIEPMLQQVVETGKANGKEDMLMLLMNRHSFLEENYITFSHSPIGLLEGKVEGIFVTVFNTTSRVIQTRYLQTLKELEIRVSPAKTVREAHQLIAAALGTNDADLPFALLYWLDTQRKQATLQTTTGLTPGMTASPTVFSLEESAQSIWPVTKVLKNNQYAVIDLDCLPPLPAGRWEDAPKKAILIPIVVADQPLPSGVLIAGVSPRRALDEDYCKFYHSIAAFIATTIANTTAYEKLQQTNIALQQKAEEAKIHHERLTQFIDTLCHELRNPLNGIYGSVDLLLKSQETLETTLHKAEVAKELKPALKEQLLQHASCEKEAIEAIDKCACYQKIIADDVLFFFKLEAGKIKLNERDFEPKKIIRDAVAMLEADIKRKNLRLHFNLPDQQMTVVGDPDRLAQVLMNLLSNAVKFTPDNGEVTVGLSQTASTNGKTVLRLFVKDTGIGISADEKPKLFDRFFQAGRRAHPEYGGSGLGLAISKDLVELMGGKIEVESEKWRGSQFSFTVLCKNAAKPKEEHVPSPPSPKLEQAPTAGLAVLIVEDNLINQKILKKQLEQAGYRHYLASHGKEALTIFEHNTVDIILMDVEMPVMNGLEATKAIREIEKSKTWQRPEVPIIGLSGNVRQEQINEAINLGMNDYLTKPYERKQLLEKIAHYTHIPAQQRTATSPQPASAVPRLSL